MPKRGVGNTSRYKDPIEGKWGGGHRETVKTVEAPDETGGGKGSKAIHPPHQGPFWLKFRERAACRLWGTGTGGPIRRELVIWTRERADVCM